MYCELDHGGGAPLDHVVIQIASGSRVVAVKSGARGSSEKTKARMLGDMEYYGCPVAVRACTREFLPDVEGTEELTLVLGTGGSFTVDWTYDCSFEEDTPPHGKDELGVVTIRLGLEVVLRACELGTQHVRVCCPVEVAGGLIQRKYDA